MCEGGKDHLCHQLGAGCFKEEQLAQRREPGTALQRAPEIFSQAGAARENITISPRGQSIMEVFLDGERIFDKLGEGNIFPDLGRVRKMKQQIADRIASLDPVAADD